MGACTSSYELPDMSDLSDIDESIKKLQGPLDELLKVVSEYNREHIHDTEECRSICQTLMNSKKSILDTFQALQNKRISQLPKENPNYGKESYRQLNGNTRNGQYQHNLDRRTKELKNNKSQEDTAKKQENEKNAQQQSDCRTFNNLTLTHQPVEKIEDIQLKMSERKIECKASEQQKEETHDDKTQHQQEPKIEEKTQNETKETSTDEKDVRKTTENALNEDVYTDRSTLERDKDKQIDDLKSELNKTNKELASLKIRYEDLVRLLNKTEQLPETSRGRLGHVQILDKGTGRLQNDAVKELKAMLSRTLNTGTCQLNVMNCCEPSDVSSEIPLLVICFVVSRLGSDVLKAIDGIQDFGKTMLLIFHHTKQPVHPSKYTLKDSQLTNLKGRIQDFAFFDGEGIYSCRMNETSMDNVADFIRNFFN